MRKYFTAQQKAGSLKPTNIDTTHRKGTINALPQDTGAGQNRIVLQIL
ncbi:MAG: hypothetical protein IPI10_10600 [Bacteroidetes bacterium]|nr:hypothetical protein [Bacteroidota bacterium]